MSKRVAYTRYLHLNACHIHNVIWKIVITLDEERFFFFFRDTTNRYNRPTYRKKQYTIVCAAVSLPSFFSFPSNKSIIERSNTFRDYLIIILNYTHKCENLTWLNSLDWLSKKHSSRIIFLTRRRLLILTSVNVSLSGYKRGSKFPWNLTDLVFAVKILRPVSIISFSRFHRIRSCFFFEVGMTVATTNYN